MNKKNVRQYKICTITSWSTNMSCTLRVVVHVCDYTKYTTYLCQAHMMYSVNTVYLHLCFTPVVKEIITNSFHLEICLLANQLHLNTWLSISLETTPFSFINLFYFHLIIDLSKSFCKITTFLSKPTLTRLCCSSGEFVITKINYNRHHELVDRYKISIFQMAMYLYLFT